MKYGILFSTVSLLLVITAISRGGWYLFCLWPAISFAVVASGYLYFGPCVYGKSAQGTLSPFNQLLLLPYLVYLWAAWYLLRLIKQETAYDQLSDSIYIGRRLLGREFPSHMEHVIDLTCEFSEPKPLRDANYHSFQVLDGFVPSPEQLDLWVTEAATFSGDIYIHCAEGHGRTGLFAAALLVKKGQFQSVEEALSFVKSKRPLVRLGRRQQAVLAAIQPIEGC